MNQYASKHDFSNTKTQASHYFNTATEAINHLEACGYWSQPIQFNSLSAHDYFFSRYAAIDWSESGLIHFSKR